MHDDHYAAVAAFASFIGIGVCVALAWLWEVIT